MDLISVIVPIYKVEPYLDRCVRSIAEQTYENLEIILVDDGSPDSCPAICDAWAAKDNRIKVIHKGNGGLSDARNAGLAVSTGEYVSFIDSDDYVTPEFITKLYNAVLNTGAEVAECATSYVDEEGAVLRLRETAEVQEMGKLEALRRLVQEDGVYQTVWNKLYRRNLIVDIPFAVGKLNEDEFWTYQVLGRINILAIVSDPMYHYLQRSSSIMGTSFSIKRLDALEAKIQRLEYFQSNYPGLVNLAKQELFMFCLWSAQMTKKHLSGADQEKCEKKIRSVWKRVKDAPAQTLKEQIWMTMARISFSGVTTLRNLLRISV